MAFTPTASRRSNTSRLLQHDHRPSTPSNLSPFARSMSTPYSLASQRQGSGSVSVGASSSPLNANTSVSSIESPVFRRNAGFGSPGQASRRSGTVISRGGSGRSSLSGTGAGGLSNDGPADESHRRRTRFIRKKTWSQKLQSLPADLFDRVSLLASTSFTELLHEPALGYPLGSILHALSLGAHLASPDSELGLSTLLPTFTKGTRGGGVLFGGGTRAGHAAAEATQQLRAMAKGQADAWWRWMAILLSLSLIALSIYNAYSLMRSRRRYSLWMRPESAPLHTESASLIEVPTLAHDNSGPTWKERLRTYILLRLSEVPILTWFIDRPLEGTSDESRVPRMHVLSVWDPNEVQLRVFCVYSPAHALQYHLLGHLGVRTPFAWLVSLALMLLFSAQLAFGAHLYQRLIKDKAILAAEVMNEYDQKFVLPRAMPLMRDASTSTSQAEFIGASEWGASVPTSPSVPTVPHHVPHAGTAGDNNGNVGASANSTASSSTGKQRTTQTRTSRHATPRGTPTKLSRRNGRAVGHDGNDDSIEPW